MRFSSGWVSPLRGLEAESAGTTASSLRSSTMAINGSALRAFNRLNFRSFLIQIGLSMCHWSLTLFAEPGAVTVVKHPTPPQ